jgi:hypothetical protein
MAEFGVFDDVFNPAQAKAQQELEEQRRHVAPAPTPAGDPERDTAVDLDSGMVVIPVTFDGAVPPPPIRGVRPDEGEPDDDRS